MLADERHHSMEPFVWSRVRTPALRSPPVEPLPDQKLCKEPSPQQVLLYSHFKHEASPMTVASRKRVPGTLRRVTDHWRQTG